eukprot:scaffold666_cov48-Cyclotella_meneghiniana.AAC.3
MGVTAETSGGQQLMMRAHRRMPRGMGEWLLVEGEGLNTGWFLRNNRPSRRFGGFVMVGSGHAITCEIVPST